MENGLTLSYTEEFRAECPNPSTYDSLGQLIQEPMAMFCETGTVPWKPGAGGSLR